MRLSVLKAAHSATLDRLIATQTELRRLQREIALAECKTPPQVPQYRFGSSAEVTSPHEAYAAFQERTEATARFAAMQTVVAQLQQTQAALEKDHGELKMKVNRLSAALDRPIA
ncbi:hypothetical protein SPRG_17838 [Saprolegnia parasitica CBS 223.65]|uniref:Uncharacterized protein n=1 Tax=Saprolegnia parasitica (strain CBS 223.65) TaxID=695850 RepID=A0A067BIW5_SAPPC|nr:hypothetical protein SPRG_17838 [Saprolegnia parasitica CBS 223.65]KDO16665.1 hypothetical protein SPRG_17838 [Saprolegnia parasitica CBS 223.65]|eukprot:XP_012212626.1 hypothetical protein SPRG_17838 [Saprolegnia parasitica CBS 223.65]